MDDDGPPGVPEWVVTYGDMMSLLLTFFIMLVSLSEVQADKKYRAVLDALQRYIGYRNGPVAPPGQHFPLNGVIEQVAPMLGSFTNEDDGTGGVKTQAVEGDDLRVFRSREGLSRRVGEPVVFSPGDASLTDAVKGQLATIAELLAGKPNKIEIRAHAAPEPLPDGSPYRDKIALTYERTRNILLFLIQQGIEPDRLRITAASDVEPLPVTAEQLSVQMDRAEILIADVFVAEYVGPRHTHGGSSE